MPYCFRAPCIAPGVGSGSPEVFVSRPLLRHRSGAGFRRRTVKSAEESRTMKALTMCRSPRGGLNLYLALFAVAVGVAAIANSALGAPTKKVYEATITPTATAAPPAFIAAGATATYLLTLTNDRTSQQGLGSANFVAPSGFSAVGATLSSAPAGKNWTANAVGG